MMSQKYIYPSLFQEEEPQESVPGDKKEYDLTNLFERLAKSDFRSRFHLSKQDREYVMERDCRRYENTQRTLWQKDLLRLSYRTTASRLPCVGILFSWLNMPLAVVAGDASSSGITSQQAGH